MNYFTSDELKCRCGCGQSLMNEGFMISLNELRLHCNFPFIVTSAYRCKKHNKASGGYPGSYHLQGRAVDIKVFGDNAHKLLSFARRYGMMGVGVSQKGDFKDRFIHLDNRSKGAVWSY